jgi:hypothetical protein
MVGVQLQRNKMRSSTGEGGVGHRPEGLDFPVLLAAAMKADPRRLIRHTGLKLLSECQIFSTASHCAIVFQRVSPRKRTGDLQETFQASLVSNPTPSSAPPAPKTQ